MKKNIFRTVLLLAAGIVTVLTGCNDDEATDDYKAWREKNENWLIEQLLLTESDGSPYYNKVTMPSDPQNYVFMHNIGTVHEENLKPLYTSTTKVNYTLKLVNDSVMDKGTGFVSQLNSSGLIDGWGLSVMQLHVGDSAQFIVPYASGYGSTGYGTIPPFSNLVFDVKLVDITAYEVRP